jgi:hypothetical protein
MLSYGILRSVDLVRTDVSEERIASIIWSTTIVELGTTLAVTGSSSSSSSTLQRIGSVLQLLVTANVFHSSLIIFTLMMETLLSSEVSVLTRATRR